MNQEQNNLNPNNFNTQGNNGIPNNQPLNNQSFNQSMGFNQQQINHQTQPTTSFQQPIMQEPTPQPMKNTFESGRASNQNFNSKPPKKMNLGLIIGIVAVVAVVGVGIVFGSKLLSNGNKDNNTNNDSNINENVDKNETTNNDNDNIQDDYSNWAKIGAKNIYVNYKTGKRKTNASSSIVFNTNHTEIIALHYNKQEAFSGNVNDVFELLNNGFVFLDVAGSSEANFFGDVNNYKIVSTDFENKKINNLDTVKFSGSIIDENGRKCYAYGYTFVLDNTPCMLVGFIFSEAQEQELINNIKNEIDIMIKTVRTER